MFKKAVRLRKHLGANKSDKHNRRILNLTEAKIKRLLYYYKKSGVVPKDWHYKPEEVSLLIKE
jgi:small subunit ribosomal protein S15